MKPHFRHGTQSNADAIDPPSALAQTKYEEGLAAHKRGDLAQAQELYRLSLELQPNHSEALHLLGVIAAQTKNYRQAIELISSSIKINPGNAMAHGNLGNAFRELRDYKAAVECYDQAIALKPDYANASHNRDHALREFKQQQTLSRDGHKSSVVASDAAKIFFRRGVELSASQQFHAAVESYDKAIAIRPDFAAAYFNRGNALNVLEQRQAAIHSYDRAIALNSDSALWQCARLATMMHVCDWSIARSNLLELIEKMQRSGRAFLPFQVLALSSSLSFQLTAAQAWINAKHPTSFALGIIPKRTAKKKIRIGYFSMNFCIHPVACLTVELFETHDRDRFEVYAFSFGPDTGDEMRVRLEAAFDQFIDVRNKSDKEIAEMARNMQIDIAVDLAGFTSAARTNIFAMRAAPLQVNYIGYPGTMGADYMDYLIADKHLIPEEAKIHYAEKIVYLPSFQANDTKRKIADRVFSREELGLPPTGVVFCCFNNNYKITPTTFDGWMRILKRVDGSVLFLYAESDLAAANLAKEASRRGVDANRLVFGRRLNLPEYLARYRAADLFLDTLPFNAGATASDALWAGLPVLTCMGEAFASRMATSLLTSIGLPELITTTQDDYEILAVELATDPERLQAIRLKLERNRLSTPLFDTKLFTRNIEDAYTIMVERYRADLPPDDIYVMPLR